jgi:PDZ domain/Aspartyl protease
MHALLIGLVCLLPSAVKADEPAKANGKTYQVPYRLTNTNHVLVRAKINGKGPYNFILDTGAPALFISPAVCEKLGIKADRKGWGNIDLFEIEGRVPLKNASARVENPFQLEGMNGLGLAGAELHGIIGYTVLAQFRLEFDFTRTKMNWTALDFKPPAPEGLGGAAPAGMNALGSIMKIVGGLLGRQANQAVTLRGFWGLALDDSPDGVVVKAVLSDGPAAKAGLKQGDRIVKVDDAKVEKVDALHKLAVKIPSDQAVKVTVVRAGENKTISLRTGKGL